MTLFLYLFIQAKVKINFHSVYSISNFGLCYIGCDRQSTADTSK